jgi:hypothetical protein
MSLHLCLDTHLRTLSYTYRLVTLNDFECQTLRVLVAGNNARPFLVLYLWFIFSYTIGVRAR